MSDSVTRNLERAASAGDVDAAVALLRARSRVLPPLLADCDGILHSKQLGAIFTDQKMSESCTFCGGTGKRAIPWADRWALAAYCGHEAARALIGAPSVYHVDWGAFTLGEMVANLRFRFRPSAFLRAAVAAAECAHAAECRWCSKADANGKRACYARRTVEAARAHVENPTDATWEAWRAARAAYRMEGFIPRPPGVGWDHVREIQAAATVAGDDVVRAAISAELIGWALGC